MNMDSKALKKHVFNRRDALNREKQVYIPEWQDLSDFVDGSRGQFLAPDRDKGRRAMNPNLYNEIAKESSITMASGMMAGITSPARPWFKLATPDPELSDYGPVKQWLDDVQRIMLAIYSRSNFYNVMHNLYLEMGIFGNGAVGAYENFDNVMRFEPYTIGSYSIGLDGERNVDTLYREYSTSIGSAAKQFGREALSQAARNVLDNGNQEEKITIIHAIEPNLERDMKSPLSKDMPYRSAYFEEGGDGDKALRVSGFQEKPFMAPRWQVTGEDVYASSYPGINSLATNKSLQIEELDLALAIEKMHNPPLVGDAALKQSGADLIAGGVTYVPNMAQNGKPGLAPVYDVNPRINELRADIKEKEGRIQRAFFADLFLMITEMDRAQITATEIAERKEEKMLMLGPVLERLNNELFDPIIDRTFAVAQRNGVLPEPPKELADTDLRVEYISVLAQAQKAISTASIESTVNFAMMLGQAWPEALHKIDAAQAIDEYAKAKGAPPKAIRSDEEVAERAQADAQQAQMAQATQQAADMAGMANQMANTPMGEQGSVLDSLIGLA